MAKPVWETKNPNKKSEPMSKGNVASSSARAKAAGSRYPTLVDYMWAKKNG